MKVHTKQIPDHGLHLEGAENHQILDLHEDGVKPVSDVHYSLDVGLSDGGLFATGQVGVDLELVCVSCLETFLYPLEISDFAFQMELNGSESVDLTPLIREDLLLALPPHPHCDWNGEKVCHSVSIRPKATRSNEELPPKPDAWGALDHLKMN